MIGYKGPSQSAKVLNEFYDRGRGGNVDDLILTELSQERRRGEGLKGSSVILDLQERETDRQTEREGGEWESNSGTGLVHCTVMSREAK